ncbi:MAG: MFS transporter [Rhodocyclaceae bacterium]|nr:MFS transporter [Rhodocyclaceae bacterium]
MHPESSHIFGTSSRWRLSSWYFCYFALIGAFSPYFTLYLRSLDFTAAAIATLMSLMSAMRLVAPNLWGWLADKSGQTMAVLRASAVLSMIGFLGLFFAATFWPVFAAMAAMAFFWSAALPLVEALTLRHLDGQAELYGRVRMWGSIGFIAAVLGTGAWLDRAPIASLLWIILAMLLGIVACTWLITDLPSLPASRNFSLRGRLDRPEVVALLAAGFFMSAAHGPFYVFYSIHLVGHGYDKTAIGVLWSLGVVAEIAVFVAMPRILKSWSIRAILLTSFVAAILRFLMIGWLADIFVVLLVGQAMHGATFGAHHAASVSAINEWFAPGQQARVLALYGSVSFGAGGMLGNLLGGVSWDMFGPGVTFSWAAVLAAVGMALIWRGMRAGCPVR